MPPPEAEGVREGKESQVWPLRGILSADDTWALSLTWLFLGIRALEHSNYSQGLGISFTHEQSWYKQTNLYMAAELAEPEKLHRLLSLLGKK